MDDNQDDQVALDISKLVVVSQTVATLDPRYKGKQKVGEDPYSPVSRPGKFIPGIGVGQSQVVYNLGLLSGMHIMGPTMIISLNYSTGYLPDQHVVMSLVEKENHMLVGLHMITAFVNGFVNKFD